MKVALFSPKIQLGWLRLQGVVSYNWRTKKPSLDYRYNKWEWVFRERQGGRSCLKSWLRLLPAWQLRSKFFYMLLWFRSPRVKFSTQILNFDFFWSCQGKFCFYTLMSIFWFVRISTKWNDGPRVGRKERVRVADYAVYATFYKCNNECFTPSLFILFRFGLVTTLASIANGTSLRTSQTWKGENDASKQ
jgi:hypothetical protein